MKTAFVLFLILILHGLLHLMGFAKAFGLTELAQPMQPISRPLGILWLAAAVLIGATAGSFLFWPRLAWPLGVTAFVLSQALIFTAWSDAKFATVANLILLFGVLFRMLSKGSLSPAIKPDWRRPYATSLHFIHFVR